MDEETPQKESFQFKDLKIWFLGPIESIDAADKILQEIALGLYFLAALQIVTFALIKQFHLFIDPLILFVLAKMLDTRKSRTAGVLLMIYSVVVFLITLMNLIGVQRDLVNGGKNLVLVLILGFAAYAALRASYAYHRFNNSQINVKHLVILNIYAFVTGLIMFFVFGLTAMIALGIPVNGSANPQQQALMGNITLSGIIIAYAMTFLRVMPFTRSCPTLKYGLTFHEGGL